MSGDPKGTRVNVVRTERPCFEEEFRVGITERSPMSVSVVEPACLEAPAGGARGRGNWSASGTVVGLPGTVPHLESHHCLQWEQRM